MTATLSPELEDLVCGGWFRVAPRTERDDEGPWVCAAGVAAGLRTVTIEEATARMDALATAGLARRVAKIRHEDAPCYKPNPTVWRVREEIFRRRGQRSPIVTARDHSLADVVLALAAGCKRANADIPAGYLAGEPDLLLLELRAVLFDRPVDEIDVAVEVLLKGGLVEARRRAPAVGEADDAVRITVRGSIEYERVVVHRLGLAPASNPYQVRRVREFTVFYVWQSDETRSRNQIKDALERVVSEANTEWKLSRPIKIETGTMIGDGAVPIDTKIFERIRAASIVVADFTPVGEFCDARCPNPNVLVEVGFALGCKDAGDVWLLEWLGTDGAGPKGGDRPFPFDVDKVHRITYSQPVKLRERLLAELRAAVTRAGWMPDAPV